MRTFPRCTSFVLWALAVAVTHAHVTRQTADSEESSVPSAADVPYTYPYPGRGNTVPTRTVSDALAERVSILDFGATRYGEKADQTAIFAGALASSSGWPITVHVPAGEYIVDGPLYIEPAHRLHLEAGASLTRTTCNANTTADAVIAVTAASGSLTGEHGSTVAVRCAGGAVNGVVRLGPRSTERYQNVEWNLIAGLRVEGPGDGIGVLVDSSEPFVGGSCYQNTLRDLVIVNVHVGVKAVKFVNANRFANLNMLSISQYGVQFVNNSENELSGIFVSSSRNISSVIAGQGSFFNSFSNVQSEPGGGQLFNFDAHSEANRVDGHDNCPHGSETHDPAFTWVAGGRVMVGNFSDAPLGYRRQLTVEGEAFIDTLVHSLPRIAQPSRGASPAALAVVEGQPIQLPVDDHGAAGWRLCGMRLATEPPHQHRERAANKRLAGHYAIDLTVLSEGGVSQSTVLRVAVLQDGSIQGHVVSWDREVGIGAPSIAAAAHDAACLDVRFDSGTVLVDGILDLRVVGPLLHDLRVWKL